MPQSEKKSREVYDMFVDAPEQTFVYKSMVSVMQRRNVSNAPLTNNVVFGLFILHMMRNVHPFFISIFVFLCTFAGIVYFFDSQNMTV